MNRESVRRMLARTGIHVVKSDADGIIIERTSATDPHRSYVHRTWTVERWRIRVSSGIGARGRFFLEDTFESHGYAPTASVGTQRELEKLLRAWRRWEESTAATEKGGE